MTTLAVNVNRTLEIGDFNAFPVIASDIIWAGAAVGIVPASGHARPLAAGDRFAGFAEAKADNSAGAAADINVKVRTRGIAQLTVTGVLITDVGNPVYATDDDTFTMSPVGGVFVGFVHRFVSTGVALVEFDALKYRDPYENYPIREALSDNKTLDAQDCGKLFWMTVDAKTVTFPAIATGVGGVLIVNGGGYGTIALTLDFDGADKIHAADLGPADGEALINTKATAKRHDRILVDLGDADGYVATQLVGTWAEETP